VEPDVEKSTKTFNPFLPHSSLLPSTSSPSLPLFLPFFIFFLLPLGSASLLGFLFLLVVSVSVIGVGYWLCAASVLQQLLSLAMDDDSGQTTAVLFLTRM